MCACDRSPFLTKPAVKLLLSHSWGLVVELLCEIDLESFLQVNLTTATKPLLSGRKVEEKKLFLKDLVNVLKTLVTKLQEQSPVKSLGVRCCSVLSPRNMAEYPKACPLKYNKLVDVMFKHNWLSSMEGDRSKCQFEDFLKSVCIPNRDKFVNFDKQSEHSDTFFGD